MSPLRFRIRAPGNLTVVFLAVAGVSVFALVWLGVTIVRQDRILGSQRLEERREGAADRLVAALERALSADERLLGGQAEPIDGLAHAGAILVVADRSGVRAWPERSLLYYPAVPAMREGAADVYRAAETLEYANRDYERVIGLLRGLSTSSDAGVRAGARLRLARSLRKAGRPETAFSFPGVRSRHGVPVRRVS